jgi:hypothetical protein
MNVVPRVTRPQVPGKNDAYNTFSHQDLVTNFELWFVRTALDSSMWWWLLHPFPF